MPNPRGTAGKRLRPQGGSRPGGLERDSDLIPPSVTVINASAGAGKTHVLTLRLIQLLLSPHIHRNGLRNILAITFTRNAAGEMKQRVLEYLKQLALGKPERLEEFSGLLSLDRTQLQARAAAMLAQIFDRYSDLQIQTIDSFMTSVFKAAAPEIGIAPEFDVALENRNMLAQAFELFLRSLEPGVRGSEGVKDLEEIAAALGALRKAEQSFAWNPYAMVGRTMSPLYTLLGAQTRPLRPLPSLDDLDGAREQVISAVRDLDGMLAQSGFEKKANFQKLIDAVCGGNVDYIFSHAFADPLKTPAKKSDRPAFDDACTRADAKIGQTRKLLADYAMARARTQIIPYSRTLTVVQDSLKTIGRRTSTVFLEDIHASLQRRLDAMIVPEIYFTLGETIFHFLIDEFQDTAPIQWSNIRLLVENVLASEGTLFVVGDTKQSIYGFRGADWTIMDRLARHPEFPSAAHDVRSLDTNYRSGEKIIRFVEEVFHRCVPATDYAQAAARSGLSTFQQGVLPRNVGKGYVEIHLFDREQEEGNEPDKQKTLDVVGELVARGYRYGDIAVLTPANDKVIEISGWLSDAGIQVISHSSLDVRKRKAAGELIGLLQFLDSPIDDLAFAQFVLGGLFEAALRHHGLAYDRAGIGGLFETAADARREPAYIRFRNRFPDLWERYFEHLYNVVGYLPLYDLLTEVAKTFSLFHANPDEEATLVKLMEAARAFEGTGQSGLKNFLHAAGDEEEEEGWEIKVPEDIDAVTVMTVHKAKGLQFPAVLVLLQDKQEKRHDYYVAEEEDGVELLYITKDLAAANGRLDEVYAAQREKERVNFLNSLYVAFTRAESELYVIGMYKGTKKIPTSFLPDTGYAPAASKPVPRGRKRSALTQAGHLHQAVRITEAPARARKFSQAELRRGELLHAILSAVEFTDPSDKKAIDVILDRFQLTEQERAQVRETIGEFLQQDTIRPYFQQMANRRVLNEQELAGPTGALFRADRIVIDPGQVTIIDFKTGSDAEREEHDRQVRNYMGILRQVYAGSTINGVVAYIDLRKVRVVQ